jgi:hypothetical protein
MASSVLSLLLVALVGAVVLILLIDRPIVLAYLVLCATVTVNAAWFGVPDALRFIFLGSLCASQLMAASLRRSRRKLPIRILLSGTGMSALLLIALLAGNGSRTTVLRTGAFVALLGAALILPLRVPRYSLERFWGVVFRSIFIFLTVGTVLRIILFGNDVFLNGGLRGPMANPNALGLLAGAALSYLVWSRGPLLTAKGRIAFVAQAVPLAGMILISQSRGAALGAVVAVAAAWVDRAVWRKAIAVAVITMSVALVGGRVLAEASRESRWVVWTTALSESAARPISGVGFGNTEAALEREVIVIPANFQGAQLHNSYVQVVFELGILIGIMFVFLAAIVFRDALRFSEPSIAIQALKGVVLFGLVSAISESWMFSVGSAFGALFWLADGSLCCQSTAHKGRRAYLTAVGPVGRLTQ